MSLDLEPGRIGRIVEQYAEGEKDAYDSAVKLQEHTDQMLTWILGLMGAGLIAGHPLLRNVPLGMMAKVRAISRMERCCPCKLPELLHGSSSQHRHPPERDSSKVAGRPGDGSIFNRR